jgi:hypothetical protein
MDCFAGLDVSLETVSICLFNAAGDVLLEKKGRGGAPGDRCSAEAHLCERRRVATDHMQPPTVVL